MGYARKREDLQLGDERNGFMRTGDLAYRDEDGCYYIVGRMGRFLKPVSYTHLMPSYCCGSMLAPFLKRGIGIQYYDVVYDSQFGIKPRIDENRCV